MLESLFYNKAPRVSVSECYANRRSDFPPKSKSSLGTSLWSLHKQIKGSYTIQKAVTVFSDKPLLLQTFIIIVSTQPLVH